MRMTLYASVIRSSVNYTNQGFCSKESLNLIPFSLKILVRWANKNILLSMVCYTSQIKSITTIKVFIFSFFGGVKFVYLFNGRLSRIYCLVRFLMIMTTNKSNRKLLTLLHNHNQSLLLCSFVFIIKNFNHYFREI